LEAAAVAVQHNSAVHRFGEVVVNVEDKIKLCRIVGVLLLSDGRLLDDEVDYMRELMERLELDEDEQVEVMDRIDGGTEVLTDAVALRRHGEELLGELQQASQADGIIAGPEVDLIQMIARVLRTE